MSTARRINWKTERERIDLAAIVTGLLGPAPGRTGEHGRSLWWRCPLPLHEDQNPSFRVEPGKPWWRCFGCGEHGDAATLVMKLENLTFPEAVSRLVGGFVPSGQPISPTSRPASPPRSEAPSGLALSDALSLVGDAEVRLWTPEGSEALAYLTGERHLTLGTIRAARLGWTPGARLPTKDGGRFTASGITLPWFDRERLALVKIRQSEGDRPKYAEAFRDHPSLYPGPGVIRPGLPLVVVEGEFDALLLGQELCELASVVTLGSASIRPGPETLGPMLASPAWYIATDADDAGDRAGEGWPARAKRVRPPEGFNDWTEARQGKTNIRRWWCDFLVIPWKPYPWEYLAGQRWGPALADPTPGIVID